MAKFNVVVQVNVPVEAEDEFEAEEIVLNDIHGDCGMTRAALASHEAEVVNGLTTQEG